jgi:hypothetical protein
MRPIYSFLAFLMICARPVLAQVYTGALRLKVTDLSGLGVKASAQVLSHVSQCQNVLGADDGGNLDFSGSALRSIC